MNIRLAQKWRVNVWIPVIFTCQRIWRVPHKLAFLANDEELSSLATSRSFVAGI